VANLPGGQGLQKANASDQPNVRDLATEILLKVDTRRSYADRLLEHAFETSRLDPRDRALLTELTYGTLRWRGRLDGSLKRWLHRPLDETDPFLRNTLRLAMYQLMFLDKIPPYAALDEAVEAAKRHGNVKAAGFVNGVLRSYLRARQAPARPEYGKASLAAVAEYWSHPEWLVRSWLNYFDRAEIEALLEANNAEPPLVLRANRRKVTRADLLSLLSSGGIRAAAAEYAPEAVRIQSHSAVVQIPGFAEGLFQVQGEASQLVAYLLGAEPGEHILDACAAPGGKTTQIAELMEDRGAIDAVDVSSNALARTKENISRLGLKSIRIIEGDVTQDLGDRLKPPYDRVLVDAPCSGFGTLRSHPEIKWNRSESDIERLARLQKKILARVAGYVKAGAVLVYSTCTLMHRENEKIVEDFLMRHGGFVLDEASRFLPEEARSMVRGKYFLALPHRHNTDGFFAARLRKVA
jgi:16S rRNA (cytosine967-C5)-methyltransferase